MKINSYESFWNERACMLQHIFAVIVRPSLPQQQMDRCSSQLLSDRTTLHGLRHPGHKSLWMWYPHIYVPWKKLKAKLYPFAN